MNVKASATISDCERYRYELSRRWVPAFTPPGSVCWVMLNPSTADAETDDPTIRRVMAFSKAFGFGGCVVVNLFGFRATNSRDLVAADDPVGPKNDFIAGFWIRHMPLVIAAWGAHRLAKDRESWFFKQTRQAGTDVRCLGVTKDGYPKHPLYLPSGSRLVPFELREGAA